MEFATPPPDISGNNASGAITSSVNPVNFSVPPPTYTKPIYTTGAGKPGHPYFRPFANYARGPGGLPMTQDDFDGKRLRKSVMRKTVDYNSSIIRALEDRIWQRDFRDRRALQPEFIYAPNILPPPSYLDNPINAVTTRFVKTATNKMRCPIFTLAWTPEGRRLVTGASSGEFTLWNGLTFNFETILQAHDAPVRTMVWSHNDNWMVTGDHGGYVKYWQSNMNNVRMFQAHKEAVRGISFSPTDNKFASCSDDGTLRIWDFLRCTEEKVLRGHGADVKCVHWHPQKSLIVSGSKDNQQPIKLWDPKSGQALATLHAHKSTVMDLKWNDNGNWLVTASRDHLLKLFDLRNLREEVQVFRGHKKEASAVSWHPVHEGLFASGGSDGSILFWMVGTDKEVGGIDTAHDSIVWTLAWHPLGHILCSGSNDHTIKFWTRNRPGDQMRDKYNLNTLPPGLQSLEDCEIDESNATIPGMGPEDKVEFTESLTADRAFIPGLDLDTSNLADGRKDRDKKQPYSKPIPRNFQAQWNTQNKTDDDDPSAKEFKDAISHYVENTPGVVPLQKITPSAIVVYGRMIEVKPGSSLERAISDGPEALNKFISSGEIEELNDVIPHIDDDENDDDDSQGSSNDLPKRIQSDKGDRPRKTRFNQDHNAQLVFDKDVSKPLGYIPPLMALNVNVNPNNPIDIDFRTNNNNNNINNHNNINSNNINNNMNNQNMNMDGGNFKSNKDSMMNPWASMNQNGPTSIWDIPPAFISNNSNMNMNNNPMNSNNMNNNNPIAFNNNNNNGQQPMKPPSLFDIKIAPPVFDDDIIDVDIDSKKSSSNSNNNSSNNNSNKSSNRTSSSSSRSDKYRGSSPKKSSDDKGRRNRDSDGKRISRFDSVENQNSSSNSTSNSTSNSGSSSSRSRRSGHDSGSRGSGSSSRRQDSGESRSSRRK